MRLDTAVVAAAVVGVGSAIIIPSVSASAASNRVPYYMAAVITVIVAVLVVGTFASTRWRLITGTFAAAVALPTGLYLGRIAISSVAGVIAAIIVSFAWFCYLGHRSNMRNKNEAQRIHAD